MLIIICFSDVPADENPVYATHEDAKQAFKELLREKVIRIILMILYTTGHTSSTGW